MDLRYRFNLFFRHLAVSLMIGSLCLYIVFFIWYPEPFSKAVGVTKIFIMMLVIDVILGPSLTFIIAKKDKPSLKFDLLIIFFIQIISLVYGIYNIRESRPVYLIFDTFKFEVVQASDVDLDSLREATSDYATLPNWKPRVAAVRQAKNSDEKQKRLFTELRTGISPSMQPALYVPLASQRDNMVKTMMPISTLKKYNSNENVEAILKLHPETIGWLPVKAREEDKVVLVKSDNDIALVDLQPSF